MASQLWTNLLAVRCYWCNTHSGLTWGGNPRKFRKKKTVGAPLLRKSCWVKPRFLDLLYLVGFTETHDALTLRLSDGDLKHLLRIQRTGLTSQVLQQYWHQIGFELPSIAKSYEESRNSVKFDDLFYVNMFHIFTLHVMNFSSTFRSIICRWRFYFCRHGTKQRWSCWLESIIWSMYSDLLVPTGT